MGPEEAGAEGEHLAVEGEANRDRSFRSDRHDDARPPGVVVEGVDAVVDAPGGGGRRGGRPGAQEARVDGLAEGPTAEGDEGEVGDGVAAEVGEGAKDRGAEVGAGEAIIVGADLDMVAGDELHVVSSKIENWKGVCFVC